MLRLGKGLSEKFLHKFHHFLDFSSPSRLSDAPHPSQFTTLHCACYRGGYTIDCSRKLPIAFSLCRGLRTYRRDIGEIGFAGEEAGFYAVYGCVWMLVS